MEDLRCRLTRDELLRFLRIDVLPFPPRVGPEGTRPWSTSFLVEALQSGHPISHLHYSPLVSLAMRQSVHAQRRRIRVQFVEGAVVSRAASLWAPLRRADVFAVPARVARPGVAQRSRDIPRVRGEARAFSIGRAVLTEVQAHRRRQAFPYGSAPQHGTVWVFHKPQHTGIES